MTDIVAKNGTIYLGHQGEGLVTRVVLPNIREGAGTIALLHQRAGDTTPYLVSVTEDAECVYWAVTSVDTAAANFGRAELQWLGEDGEVLKSKIYRTYTEQSLTAPGPAPDPWEDLAGKVAASADAAKKSEDAAARYADTAYQAGTAATKSAERAAGSATAAAESEENAAASAKQATTAATGAEASASAAAASSTSASTAAKDAAAALKALKDGIAAGDFKGEKGDKGDKGDPGTDGKDAPQIDDDAISAGNPWSSKNIVDMLCPSIEETGNPVQCSPVPGYPLGVVASWEPVQEGTGDPSPENVRPISGRDAVNVNWAEGIKGWQLITLDGTEKWITPADKKYYAAFGYVPSIDNGEKWGCCTHYPYGFPTSRECALVNQNGAVTFYGLNTALSRDEFKAWLAAQSAAGTPVQIAYKLASAPIAPEDGGIYFAEQPAQSGSGDPSPTNIRPILLDGTVKDGGTTMLQLPKTIYGGSVDAVSGAGNSPVNIITIDGTNVKFTEKGRFWNLPYNSVEGVVKGSATLFCSHFERKKFSMNVQYQFLYTIPERFSELFSTVDALNGYCAGQFAAGTPVQILYELGVPAAFRGTGAQPILALPGVNTILTDADTVTVTGRADPIKRITDLEDAVASMTTEG